MNQEQVAAGLIDLEFLTDDDRERELCRSYWRTDSAGKFRETVALVANRFGLPASKLSALVAQKCIASFPDESCSACGARRPFKTRSEFEERDRYRRRYGSARAAICMNCQEAQRRDAQLAAEEVARRRVAVLQRALEDLRNNFLWPSPEALSFEDAVYLVSLFRAGGAEDLSYVVPHAAYTSSLSPSRELDRRILDRLYQNEIIGIHPGSSHDSVEFDGEKFTSFFPLKVHWLLPTPSTGPSSARYLEELERLLQTREEWPDDWHEDADELRRVVAYEECLEYLRIALDEHGFDLRPGHSSRVCNNRSSSSRYRADDGPVDGVGSSQ